MRTLVVTGSVSALAIAFAFSGAARAADCLQAAADYADKVCGQLERSGSEIKINGDANAEASLNSIIKKFVDASGAANVGATAEKYEGLARDELVRDRFDARGCRERRASEAFALCPKPAAMPASPPSPSSPTVASPPSPALAAMPRPAPVTTSVQFGPRDYAYGPFRVAVAPCVQSSSSLDCDVSVSVAPGRNTGWMVDRGSAIQDEVGAKISPTWVTIEGKTINLMNGGRTVQLTPGVATIVKYHFDNVRDATRLQSLSLTFCCTRNIPFLREH